MSLNEKTSPNRINKRQIILDAATKLMMEKGIEQTTLGDIAEESGLSKGTLYYYYPSKADLVYDVTMRHFNVVTTDIMNYIIDATNSGKANQEISRRVINSVIGEYTRSKLHLYLLQEAVLNNEALKVRFQETYREWRSICYVWATGLLSEEDPRSKPLSFILLAILDGFVTQSIIGAEHLDIDEIANCMSLLF